MFLFETKFDFSFQHIEIDEKHSSKSADVLALYAHVKSNFVPAVVRRIDFDERKNFYRTICLLIL